MTNNEFFGRTYKPYQEQHMTKSTCYTRCNIIGNRLLDEHGEETPNDISYLVIEGIYDGMEAEGLKQNTAEHMPPCTVSSEWLPSTEKRKIIR